MTRFPALAERFNGSFECFARLSQYALERVVVGGDPKPGVVNTEACHGAHGLPYFGIHGDPIGQLRILRTKPLRRAVGQDLIDKGL